MRAPHHPTTLPTVRWIGPETGGDIGPCWRWTRHEARLVDGDADLTVLACPRPLVDTATALSIAAASDDFVQLLGVWCEGEGRTGRTIDGAERVFWHAWPTWWRTWLANRSDSQKTIALPRLVSIDTPDGELAKALVAALGDEGIVATWSRMAPTADADMVLWDGAQLNGREANRLAAVTAAARRRRTPVVALLDFPRPETVAAARAIGAAGVVGKPFDGALLFNVLRLAMRTNRGHSMAGGTGARWTASHPLPGHRAA